MAKLAIFMDGGYVDKLAEEEFQMRVDYQKLVDRLVTVVSSKTHEPVDLFRTYYYHCLPFQSSVPTPEEQTRYSQKRKFFEALRNLPRFTVREGRLARVFDESGHPIFQQKRVDLLLGLELALLSGKHQITHAAIIAGDSDLLPAFEVAKQEGVSVWIFHGPRRSRKEGRPTFADELRLAADERLEIDASFMQQVRR